jgi:N-acetyl-1-D-myo-inositol-2-amino-2-deoxy-alpha-D-glucopyranoside deacetylase
MSSPETLQQHETPSTSRDFERVLVIHAHPDDETIVTGATLATLVADGSEVTVVTCTRGELGEVMPDELARLRGDAVALGAHREGEIAEAMAALGVTDHRFLGAPGARTRGLEPRPYRDSGMEWGPDGRPVPVDGLHPAAFCSAEFGEIVSDLSAVIAEVRPEAILSYDSDGGYGHPDHVRVGRASLRAARLADVPYYAITTGSASASTLPSADVVVVDGHPVLDRKVTALEAYRTQIRVLENPEGPALEYPHGAIEPVSVIETFRFVPEPAPVAAPEPPLLSELGPLGRALTGVFAFVGGALFGAIGTVTHQISAGSFPIGAVLSLLMVLGVVVGARIVFESRFIGVLAALGIVMVTAILTLPGSGGSVLVPGNPAGYAWTFGPTAIAVVVLAWPRLPQARGGRMGTSPQDVRVLPEAKEQFRP